MRLTRVHLSRFRNLPDIDLDLQVPGTEEGVGFAALVGPNACGKSSILEAIAWGCWMPSPEWAVPIQGDLPQDLTLWFGHQRLHFAEYRLQIDAIGLELRNDLSKHFLFLPTNRDPRVPGQTLQYGQPVRFGPGLASSTRAGDTGQRAQLIHRWIVTQQLAAERDTTLWSALEPFLGEVRFQGVHQTTLELLFRTASATVTFDQLSSGQRQLVFMFAEVLMHCGPAGLLLIDEPEAHLHPTWQRALPRALQTLLPQGQILVATHSPYIIHGLAPHQLFVLGEIDAMVPS